MKSLANRECDETENVFFTSCKKWTRVVSPLTDSRIPEKHREFHLEHQSMHVGTWNDVEMRIFYRVMPCWHLNWSHSSNSRRIEMRTSLTVGIRIKFHFRRPWIFQMCKKCVFSFVRSVNHFYMSVQFSFPFSFLLGTEYAMRITRVPFRTYLRKIVGKCVLKIFHDWNEPVWSFICLYWNLLAMWPI